MAELRQGGIDAIFPPGSNIETIAVNVLTILGKRQNVA
jgi:methylmalonyl-CoA mutase cobalamin-binding subunit